MSLVVHRAQSGDRDVRVELGGGQAGVTEQFLHDAQIGAAFEQVGGRAVPQTVRAHVGSAVDGGDGLVHDGASLADVEPTAPGAQQQRRPGLRGDQRRAPVGQPDLSASAAGSPNGALRCLLPLPSTRSNRCPVSTSSTSRPHSSLTRMPVAYSSSTIRRSRNASGSPCCEPDFAADMAASAWSCRSTAGNARRALGTCSRVAGSPAISPRRTAHAVNVLTAEVRRASVVRAAPAPAPVASHDRNIGRLNAGRPVPGARSSRNANNDRRSPR